MRPSASQNFRRAAGTRDYKEYRCKQTFRKIAGRLAPVASRTLSRSRRDSSVASPFLLFAAIQTRSRKFPKSTHDKISHSAIDPGRSRVSAASPFRLRHKSIPESRSSIRRGFVRPNDKAHSGQPREKCGATSSCPTNPRNGETKSSHKSLRPAANARSANGAGCSSGARSRERRTPFAKAARSSMSRPVR